MVLWGPFDHQHTLEGRQELGPKILAPKAVICSHVTEFFGIGVLKAPLLVLKIFLPKRESFQFVSMFRAHEPGFGRIVGWLATKFGKREKGA